jgi:hypothetical protein
MPLALNDAEYAAVMQAAGPVHRLQRDAFLKALWPSSSSAIRLSGPALCTVAR